MLTDSCVQKERFTFWSDARLIIGAQAALCIKQSLDRCHQNRARSSSPMYWVFTNVLIQ